MAGGGMNTINWDRKFEVGHERIDFEHRIFVDLIRSFAEEAESVAAPDARRLNRQLTEITKYAEFHFVSEENIMIEVGYPDFETHRELHNVLLNELRDMAFRLRAGRANPRELVDFLYQWFAQHTAHKDKLIAEYVRQSGAMEAAPA
jgi:hemerythrin